MCLYLSWDDPVAGLKSDKFREDLLFPKGTHSDCPQQTPTQWLHLPLLLPLFQTCKGLSKRHINSSLGYYCGNFDGCLYTAQTKPALDYVVLTLLMLKSNLYGVTGTPQQVSNPSWGILVKSSDPANRNRSLPKVVELRLHSTIFKHII